MSHQVTPTINPNLDAIVFKTHALSIILIIIALIIVAKYVLPQIVQYFERRANIETNILQNSLTKLVEGQEKMHMTLIDSLTDLKKRATTGSFKIIAIILFTLSLSFFGCDSDSITIYTHKTIVAPIEIKQEAKPQPVILNQTNKICSPACTGNTVCNSSTGQCEGKAIRFDLHSDYLVDSRNGSYSPGDELKEIYNGR